MITATLYIATVFFTSTVSILTKRNGQIGGDPLLFQLARAIATAIFFCGFALLTDGFGADAAFWLAAVCYGIFFAVSMQAGYCALQSGPMGLTSAIVSFSLVIPLLHGVLFLQERMTLLGICGLILIPPAVCAIRLGKSNASAKPKKHWWLFIFITFCANGINSVIQKLYALHAPGAHEAAFLCVSGCVCALVFASLFWANHTPRRLQTAQGGKLNASVFGFGVLAGIANGLVNFFTLMLAAGENSSILFPVISVSTLATSLLSGRLIFRERIRPIQLLGVLLAAVAVLLLKLKL